MRANISGHGAERGEIGEAFVREEEMRSVQMDIMLLILSFVDVTAFARPDYTIW